jgi:phage I-like protein
MIEDTLLQELTAALSGDGAAVVPGAFQIFPAGQVNIEGEEPITVDDAAMDRVIQHFRARGLDMVIDYEHQTEEGNPAPAAGWIKDLENRGVDGLWARVEWTQKAGEYLANREYRYFSPVFLISRADRRLMELLRVALTNAPRLNRIRPIVARLGAPPPASTSTRTEESMFLETIAKQLGLPEGAQGQDVSAAVAKLVRQSAAPAGAPAGEPARTCAACAEIRGALDLPGEAGSSEIIASIHALKQRPDLGLEVADLRRRLAERDRDDLVTAALREGKITPAQKEWAQNYALRDPGGFRLFTAKAPRIVPTDALDIIGDGPRAGDSPSGDGQLRINRMMGISTETWQKFGPRDEP